MLERVFIDGVSSPSVARTVARLADGSIVGLKAWIGVFVRTFDVDMSEVDVPDGGFRSFNAFFARRLRQGARPIDHQAALVSPCDGRLTACGVADGELAVVKGRRARVSSILDDVGMTASDKTAAIIYLAPRDYHRVHAPAAGVIEAMTRRSGSHYPVNALGLRHHPDALTTNERLTFLLDCEDVGKVVVSMVAAANVSSIVPSVEVGATVAVGDDLASFQLGSTVVVFADARLACSRFEGEVVRVGEALHIHSDDRDA